MNKPPAVILTAEQEEIIATDVDSLGIEAGAGSSKTTTLVLYAFKHPKERILYVAYNAAIKEEAKSRFPSNVSCYTSHGIAFGKVGKYYSHKLKHNGGEVDKLQGSITNRHIISDFKLQSSLRFAKVKKPILCKVITEALNRFLCDLSTDPDINHVAIPKVAGTELIVAEDVLAFVQSIWDKMRDPQYAGIPMTHDGYLKMFYLEGYTVGNYDRILFDETQDANKVTMEIVRRSRGKKIFVGDRNQSIYGFRGAVDAMQTLETEKTLRLTGSFRFGGNIANAANRLLIMKGGLQLTKGLSQDVGDVIIPSDNADYKAHVENALASGEKIMMLSYGGTGVMDHAINASSKGKRMFFVGGAHNYRLNNLMDVYALKYGGYISDAFIKSFESFEELKEYGKHDREIEQRIGLVEVHKEKLPSLIENIKKLTVDKLALADVILSTVHKAKGLESDTVVLSSDMPGLELKHYFVSSGEMSDSDLMELVELGAAVKKTNFDVEDTNVAYVAITRAKKRLILPDTARALFLSNRITSTLAARILTGDAKEASEAKQAHKQQAAVKQIKENPTIKDLFDVEKINQVMAAAQNLETLNENAVEDRRQQRRNRHL